MSDRISTTFSTLLQNFKPGSFLGIETGGDQHLRADIVNLPNGTQANRLYLHTGISGSGVQAMQNRMTKWADGAAFVKQSIDSEYGAGMGDLVFQKILDESGMDLSQGVRRRDLNTIQATMDGMMAPLRQKFADRGLNDANSAKTHAANMFTAVGNTSNQDAHELNQRLLGGGNYAMQTLFRHPEILNIADDQERRLAFEQAFDAIANPVLDAIDHQVDQDALDPNHASHGMSKDDLAIIKMGKRRSIEVTKRDGADYLSDPKNVQKAKGFVDMSAGLNLPFEDAMATIRSRGNIRSVTPDALQAAIDKLFAGEVLTAHEYDMVNYLFPGASS